MAKLCATAKENKRYTHLSRLSLDTAAQTLYSAALSLYTLTDAVG